MTQTRPVSFSASRRLRLRRAVSVFTVLAIVVSALMPLSQAMATAAGSNTLVAAICSPNGLRYIEIDLGTPEDESPSAPSVGLEHCLGCLSGSVPALLPVLAANMPVRGETLVAPGSGGLAAARDAVSGFHPRAPPASN